MLYEGKYVVDPAFERGDNIIWADTGNGEYIIATSGGVKYFIKRSMHIRRPLKGLPKVVFDKYKSESDVVIKKQKRLHELMHDLSMEKDHIVVEESVDWDSDDQLATITRCVPNPLDGDFDYTSLSLNEFLQLAKDITKDIIKLHERGVIHGDLKEPNILVRDDGGNYIAYVVDFDTSYPSDAIPYWMNAGGTDGYRSPELVIYGDCGDVNYEDLDATERAAMDASKEPLRGTITPATDVFTLGVVFHKWWTGVFPNIDMDYGTVGDAINLGREVTIDDKFNVRIGDNCGATLKSLINWMFAKDPKDRPTAQQVLNVLSDLESVPVAYHKGKDDRPFDDAVWSAHKLMAELLSVDELQRKGVKSLKRVNEGKGESGLKYRVITNDGKDCKLSIEELCSNGYALLKTAEVDKPWEEHMIEFESPDVIFKKGYSKIERRQYGYKKQYSITSLKGSSMNVGAISFDKGRDWLINQGLAHPIKKVVDTSDTPWPEHGTAFNGENMAMLKIKSISKMELGGIHCYRIVYEQIMEDGKNKVREGVSVNNIKLMGLIK